MHEDDPFSQSDLSATLLELLPDPAMLFDRTERLIYVNSPAQRLWPSGLPALYTPTGDPVAWADTPAGRTLADGQAGAEQLLRWQPVQGPPQTARFSSRPVYRAGQLQGALLLGQPVALPAPPTDPATGTEYERLSAVIADLQITMAVHDAAGRVTVVNETWLRRTGLRRGDVLGRRLSEIADNPFFHTAQQLVDRVLTTGERQTVREHYVELFRNQPGGYVDGSVVAVRAADGTITGAVSATTDVTEKVRARQAVEAAHARLAHILEQLPVAVVLIERYLLRKGGDGTETRNRVQSGHVG